MTTRPLSEDEWELYREIRLRALADTPSAFGSTLERERGFTEADWRQRMRGPMVVVEEEGDPVASGGTFEDADGVTCVWGMWTEPTSRGRGHATAILHGLPG
ncbi:GNAT family N-acetyltransferase [Nostocoides australiense]|nr:GNAT family N-acetyltransferase [Tetrasphaera australiensis]HRW03437.1 GNAT family N-acetyltransferase [Tetrasphaera sp.]